MVTHLALLVARVHVGKVQVVFRERDDARVGEHGSHVGKTQQEDDEVKYHHIERTPQPEMTTFILNAPDSLKW